MKTKKTEYQITVAYKAIVSFTLKAETLEDAEKIVLDTVKGKGIYAGSIDSEDYSIAGTLDMDKTWNQF